jgi:hypothetical protein
MNMAEYAKQDLLPNYLARVADASPSGVEQGESERIFWLG